jgi:capsular polysaccharide biosynthesis protein
MLFPSFLTSPYAGYLHGPYLQEFLKMFSPNRPRRRKNRIFISRDKGKTMKRCLLNENELYNCLSKYGFNKYVLEKMSIEEQIDLFYDAEYVVGAHGAGLTNLVFSENAKVLEIFPSDFVAPYYYYLAKSTRNPYFFCYGNAKNIHSNFSVNIEEIENQLNEMGLTREKFFSL